MARHGGSADPASDEPSLPRPPGVIRRYWARHPVFADVLITLICLPLTLGPAFTFRTGIDGTAPYAASGVLVPLGLIACLLLLRRRQWPLTVLTASYILGTAFAFAPYPVGAPLVLVTSYSVAVYRSTRAAWLGLAIGMGSLGVIVLGLTSVGAISWASAANALVGGLVLALIGTLIGTNVGNRKRYIEAIIDRSRQLHIEREQHARLAAAAERTRIAREMHDIVSHSLTVIVALAEGAAATPDRERGQAATLQVATTARGALTEMRAMLGVLRDDSAPDDAPLVPVDDDTIPAAVASARSAGLPVALTITGSAIDARAVRFAAARIVQEGLTNVMRHAPAARSVEVSVASGDTGVDVSVTNDGATATAPHSSGAGYGLRGLSERVGRLGGTVTAGPLGSQRWRLVAHLPLPASQELT